MVCVDDTKLGGKADATDGLVMTQKELMALRLDYRNRTCPSIWVWRKSCSHDTILPDGKRNHLPPRLRVRSQSFEMTVTLAQARLVLGHAAVPNLK